MKTFNTLKFAILGSGYIGQAIVKGFIATGKISVNQIIITRRNVQLLKSLAQRRFVTQTDNCDAVRKTDVIIIAVQPKQLNNLLSEIRCELSPNKHIIISVVSGVSSSKIIKHIGKKILVVRAVPTTTIALLESMTCIASKNAPNDTLQTTKALFDLVGETTIIDEEQMISC